MRLVRFTLCLAAAAGGAYACTSFSESGSGTVDADAAADVRDDQALVVRADGGADASSAADGAPPQPDPACLADAATNQSEFGFDIQPTPLEAGAPFSTTVTWRTLVSGIGPVDYALVICPPLGTLAPTDPQVTTVDGSAPYVFRFDFDGGGLPRGFSELAFTGRPPSSAMRQVYAKKLVRAQ